MDKNIYIIDSLKKYFYSEKDLIKFLVSEKSKAHGSKFYLEGSKVKVINYDKESESSCRDYFESFINGLNIDHDDKENEELEYENNARKFINRFKDLAPTQPWDNMIRKSAEKVLNELETTPYNRKDFSKVIKRNYRYILYCVSNSVEWYTSVLELCDFKKLSVTCDSEYVDPITRGSIWRGHRTPDIMIKNFEIARNITKTKKPSG